MILYRRDYIVFSLVVIILVLYAVQLTLENYYSIDGIKLGKIEAEITQYKKENDELRQQLLHDTAYVTITDKAKALGFEDAKPQDYVFLH